MKSCHIVAPLSVLISIPIGLALALPCCMCWDAGEQTKPYMKLLGCSGLSVIPVAVTACAISLTCVSKKPLALNLLPYAGLATAFAIGATVEKNEHNNQQQ